MSPELTSAVAQVSSKKWTKYTAKQKFEIIDVVGREYLKNERSVRDICKAYGVVEDTFFHWVAHIPAFKAKWTRYRERAELRLAATLPGQVIGRIEKSLGDYFVTEIEQEEVFDAANQKIARKVKTSRKYVPPNARQINYLSDKLDLLRSGLAARQPADYAPEINFVEEEGEFEPAAL